MKREEREEREIKELLERSFAEKDPAGNPEPKAVETMWRIIDQDLDGEQKTTAPDGSSWLSGLLGRLRRRPRLAFGLAVTALGAVLVLWVTVGLERPGPSSNTIPEFSSGLSPEILQLERAITELEYIQSGEESEVVRDLRPAYRDLDLAIGEAKSALRDNPESDKVNDHLVRYLQRKLCLLRAVTIQSNQSGRSA